MAGSLGAPELVIVLFFFGGLWLLPAFLCWKIAADRGQAGPWWLLGLFLGFLGVVIALLVVPKSSRSDKYAELSQLDDLRRRGIITEEQFAAKRDDLVRKI